MHQLHEADIYPAHLSDPVRLKLADEIIEKELAKQGWSRERPSRLLLDYWDTFHAIMGTWLLKARLGQLITAENWQWTEQTISVEDIQFTAFLDQLQEIPGLSKEDLRVRNIKEKLADTSVYARQQQIHQQFAASETQNAYRIIAIKEGDIYKVLDGNRRTLRALLAGDATIAAWVAETHEQPPRNYWIPIDHMMLIVEESQKNPEQLAHYQAVAAQWFTESDAAKLAYQRRVLGMKGALALWPQQEAPLAEV